MVSITPPAPDAVLAGFARRTLTRDQWTHEAHLTVCWYTVMLLGAAAAADHLRDAIAAFNGSIGVVNSTSSGYHETLTRYYVDAVAHVEADHPAALFDHPLCNRDAPTVHWSHQRLFSPEARAAWVEPDLRPLPWPLPWPLGVTRAEPPGG